MTQAQQEAIQWIANHLSDPGDPWKRLQEIADRLIACGLIDPQTGKVREERQALIRKIGTFENNQLYGWEFDAKGCNVAAFDLTGGEVLICGYTKAVLVAIAEAHKHPADPRDQSPGKVQEEPVVSSTWGDIPVEAQDFLAEFVSREEWDNKSCSEQRDLLIGFVRECWMINHKHPADPCDKCAERIKELEKAVSRLNAIDVPQEMVALRIRWSKLRVAAQSLAGDCWRNGRCIYCMVLHPVNRSHKEPGDFKHSSACKVKALREALEALEDE